MLCCASCVCARRYHAKLPLSERVSAHREFQRDDASVMVASLAFGMGIDKPNIRRIIHYVSVHLQAPVGGCLLVPMQLA